MSHDDLRVGQGLVGGETCVLVERGSVAYRFGPGAPPDTATLVRGLTGRSALRARVAALEAVHGLVPVGDAAEGAARYVPRVPLAPPEAWAVGVTYRRQALEHDTDLERRTGRRDDLYAYVYSSARAEVFFKGLARTVRGPGEAVTIRADSKQVMPEAELVLVLGDDGLPIAYTLGNDLTAWDLECETPLFLSQAKVWSGSASIGPWLVPADSVDDAYGCRLTCEVWRGGDAVIVSEGSTAGLKRSIEELCAWLSFANAVPAGTVLFTGTACVIPHDFALAPGDRVIVRGTGLGTLENPVALIEGGVAFPPPRVEGE